MKNNTTFMEQARMNVDACLYFVGSSQLLTPKTNILSNQKMHLIPK